MTVKIEETWTCDRCGRTSKIDPDTSRKENNIPIGWHKGDFTAYFQYLDSGPVFFRHNLSAGDYCGQCISELTVMLRTVLCDWEKEKK